MAPSIDSLFDSISQWFSSLEVWDTDEGEQESCPVAGLNYGREYPARANVCTDTPPKPLGDAIQELARRQVDPDTFHLETPSKRFASLSTCEPMAVSIFKARQNMMIGQIGSMSPESIAAQLKGLYDEAYRYDQVSQTMDVANPAKKRELDLWIAVLDNRAFRDPQFLKGVKIPSIELILTLNSDRLSPADRAIYHQVDRGWLSLDEFNVQIMKEDFEWLMRYDGRGVVWEKPYIVSKNELFLALKARFGKKTLTKIIREHFPKGELQRTLVEADLKEQYVAFQELNNDVIIEKLIDVAFALGHQADARSQKILVRELILLDRILQGRGVDHEEQARKRAVTVLIAAGYTEKDARLMANTEAVNNTASRLDDYAMRQQYMEKYRELYQEFLVTPMSERFSAENQMRYNMWGHTILASRNESGVPMLLSDLQSIRYDVQNKARKLASRSAKVDWKEVSASKLKVPLWIRPEDIIAGRADKSIQDMLQSDLIADNVEHIAIMPPAHFEIPHALAVAHGLFGVAVLQSGEFFGPEGWSVPLFKETLRHEAAHLDWFNEFFSEQPNKLSWLAANELYAYNTGLQSLESDLQSKSLSDDQEEAVMRAKEQAAVIVSITKQRLGMSDEAIDGQLTFPQWKQAEDALFHFQPAQFLSYEKTDNNQPIKMRAWSESELSEAWKRLLPRYVGALNLSPDEEKELKKAIAALDQMKGDERSTIYRHDHPFLRLFNRLSQDVGAHMGNPNPGVIPSIALSAAAWKSWKESVSTVPLSLQQEYDNLYQEWASLSPHWMPFLRYMVGHFRIDVNTLHHFIWTLDMLEQGRFDQPNPIKSYHPLLGMINKMRAKSNLEALPEINIQSPQQWLHVKIFLIQSYLQDKKQVTG